jgi:uncharacterized protein YjhX (UPF0386 family)
MKRLALALALTVAPIAVVSPVEASKPWLCPKYTEQIKQTFKRKDWRTMDAIMWRESKCVTRAVGWNYRKPQTHKNCTLAPFEQYRRCKAVKSWDVGLFQINSSWNTITTRLCGKNTRSTILMQPDCNFRVAKWLYQNGGLAHWQGNSN